MVGVLDALRALGGAARLRDVYEWLVGQDVARATDLATVQRDGGTRFEKEVRFARLELARSQLLESKNGGWELTPEGWRTHLTVNGARELVSSRRHRSA
jgi:restriction system protein